MVPQIQGALALIVLAGGLYFVWQNRGLVSGFFTRREPPTPADDSDAIYAAVRTLRPLCESAEEKAAWKVIAIKALEYKA